MKINIIIFAMLLMAVSCTSNKSTVASYRSKIAKPVEYSAWVKNHKVKGNARVKRAKDFLSFQKEENKRVAQENKLNAKINGINLKTESIKN